MSTLKPVDPREFSVLLKEQYEQQCENLQRAYQELVADARRPADTRDELRDRTLADLVERSVIAEVIDCHLRDGLRSEVTGLRLSLYGDNGPPDFHASFNKRVELKGPLDLRALMFVYRRPFP